MADPHDPLVSVVIPHYNDLQNLANCLDSLRRQTYPRGQYKVIVADNNSAGGVAAVERTAPDVTVIAAPDQGAGPARNAGAAAATGSHLAFIDSDCVADNDWLLEGIAALAQYDYVGGRVITTVNDADRLSPAEAFEAVFAFDFETYIRKDKFSGSGNLFVPKTIFDQVGGFRAGVAEDIDWCHRANALGFRLGYAERAIVYHAARREWSELTKRWDRVMVEMLRLAMERPGWRRRWAVYAAAVGVSPLAHWVRIVRSRRLEGLGAKSRGLLGLFRIRSYRSYRMMRILFYPPK
jgi:GT2 family glycosyltransferase